MSGLLTSIESLPQGPLYAAIGVCAALENIFPPVPADTIVAFGAFLAGRGTLDGWTVFGLTWAANSASAAGVYLLGHHYGRPFFEGALGRRLISARTLARIEEAYQEYGAWGMFLTRLLPVWRAVVPPFAGVARVPPGRVIPPVIAASALWYGAITWAVFRLGRDFEFVTRALAGVNLALAALALGLLVMAGLWFRRRIG